MISHKPHRYSVLVGIYLLILLLTFSVILLTWAYNSSVSAIDKELSTSFNQIHTISESLLEHRLEAIEQGLRNVSSNNDLIKNITNKDKSGTNRFLYRVLDSDENSGFDFIFVRTRDSAVWTEVSSSLFDVKPILRYISRKSRKSSKGVAHRFKSGGIDITSMLKYVPIINNRSGKIIGQLCGGVILNDNLSLVDKIRIKTGSKSVIMFSGGDIISSTDKRSADITLSLIKARKEVKDGEIYKNNKVIASYSKISLFGIDTPLEVMVANSNKSFLDLKRSYKIKSIILFSLSLLFFIVTIFIINYFTYPSIKKLLTYSEDISANKSDAHYTPGNIIELNSIGQSMVKMVETLENANREIKLEIEQRSKTEGTLNTLIKTIPDLVWFKDKDGRYLFCNNRFERFFGAKASEIIGKTDYDFVDKELADFFRANDLKAIAKDGPSINEEEVVYADDNHKEILETIKTPVYSDKGELIGVMGVARDITQLKENETELRQEKEFTEAALDSQPDTFFLFNPTTGKAIRWNKAFNIITGYSDEEIIENKAPHSYYSEEDLKRAEAFIGKVMESGRGTIELDLICKDGHTVPTEYNVSVIKEKDSIYLISIGRDLTERKALELRFHQLAENSSDWIWEFDENNIFTYSSSGVINLLGYTPEEIIGKSAFDLIPSPEKEKVAKEFAKSKDNHKPFENIENINQHKDGHLVTIESSGTPIFNSDGDFKGYRGIDRDITDRKSMEEKLRQSHKMESIGTLTGGIAHDFNNILSIIVGNTEIALTKISDSFPVFDNIKEIKTASLRAKDVVNQLLSYTRKTGEEKNTIDISPVVKESLKLIRSLIPSSIKIAERIPDKCDPILGDATQIHQVIINLCTNAAHAMEKERGVLTITLDSLLVDEKSEGRYRELPKGNYIELVVEDTGAGIETQTYEKIFDPYFTTKEVGKGTGMGLAVVHGIVKNHGGRIFVESEINKGSVFTIVFPAVDNEVTIEVTDEKEEPTAGNETLLFVDDEEPIAKMAEIYFSSVGYNIVISSDPVEALSLFEKDPDFIDIVVSDMTMPGMSGVELTEKIRSIKPDIPVVICSGFSSSMDEEKAKKLGISAFAMKPITMVEIAKIVREIFDN